LIVASAVASALNWLVVGPLASGAMLERHRLERLEGKEYDEPFVSGSALASSLHFLQCGVA
jgi:hypothetical protein